MRPPGLRTRSISRIAPAGRGAKMCANWLRTTSNSTSRNGRASTSPSLHTMSSTPAIAAFSLATTRSSGVRSSPVATAPARRAVIVTTPVPHPTSRILWPGRTPANLTSRAAGGVVIVAIGAKSFQPSRCFASNSANGSDVIVATPRGEFFGRDNGSDARVHLTEYLDTPARWRAHDERPSSHVDGRRNHRAVRCEDADHHGELPEARREEVLRRHNLP